MKNLSAYNSDFISDIKQIIEQVRKQTTGLSIVLFVFQRYRDLALANAKSHLDSFCVHEQVKIWLAILCLKIIIDYFKLST